MFQSRRKVKTKNKTYNYCVDNKTTGESGKPIDQYPVFDKKNVRVLSPPLFTTR